MSFDRRKVARSLRDIQRHIALAENFVADTTYEAFKDDLVRLYPVTPMSSQIAPMQTQTL